MKKTFIGLLVISYSSCFAYQNTYDNRGERQKEMRVPPQEAITICEGKNSGDSCSITSPRGDSINGTCEDTPDGKYFACKPEHKR